MSRRFIYFWVYVLPLPLFAVMYFAWAAWSTSHIFALYVMFLPVIYGYIAPGIATNVLHKWRFKGPWVVGSFYLHHGFKYSSNMSPLLFIAFLGTHSLSVGPIIRVLICTAGLNAFVIWIHDILLVRHGMVEIYNRPAAEGRSPEEIVTYYAPLCFFLIGLSYAAGALLAYQVFAVQHATSLGQILWVSAVGATMLFLFPGLAYAALDRPSKKVSRLKQ